MSSRQSSLLAALQRKSPQMPAASTAAPAALPPPSLPQALDTAAKPARRVGKPVQFWLHEEDRKLVRELAAWLAGQGIRPTDSMVVRAALRTAKPGATLLDAYRQSALLDGRLRVPGAKATEPSV